MNEFTRVVARLGSGPGRVRLKSFTRDNLAFLFAELGYTRGVELGVYEGAYSEVLCKANSQLRLTSIDCWTNFPLAFPKAQERLRPYNAEIIKSRSDDIYTLNRFPDGSLDFVYIDADHTQPAPSRDIYYWTEKVRIGGMIAGHDYHLLAPQYQCDVVQAVDEYTAIHKISPWYVTNEPEASWFWVKQFNQLT